MGKTIQQLINLSGIVILLTVFSLCSSDHNDKAIPKALQTSATISKEMQWSERMVYSVIKRAPEAWMNDYQKKPKWNYTHGLLFSSILDVSRAYGKDSFFKYVKEYGDLMISEDGSIRTYDISKYNIDHVAPGPMLYKLLDKTQDPKYEKAIKLLKRQLDWQPQTTDGGYWHKLRYPWQMWLDGLFMGEPFMAEYAVRNNSTELLDHVVHQFALAEKHMKDPESGLLYHGWDESRNQKWSDPETGCSSEFWARAIGWYCMGIVDVLDYFPEDHEGRKELVSILKRTLDAVNKVRDPDQHVWWQVLDRPHEKGNYLESTSSCMFTYAMIKGYNDGYLDDHYKRLAKESYEGILKTFIREDDSGEVHLTNCCAVAGLGGNPYRDGTYEYYIGEPIRDNDPKGVGPFIKASLEFEKAKRKL